MEVWKNRRLEVRANNPIVRLSCVLFSALIVASLLTSILALPSVSSVSPASAEPSQTIIVQGENFYNRNQTEWGSKSTPLMPYEELLASRPEDSEVYEVTLITGDVVIALVKPDGQKTFAVRSVDQTKSWQDFQIFQRENKTYVVPNYVDLKRLDIELFNIDYLIEEGYHEQTHLPLLIVYKPDIGSKKIQSIEDQIMAVGQSVKKYPNFFTIATRLPVKNIGSSFKTLVKQDVEKIWLDRKVSVSLSESVPLIGAPSLWAAGYTGAGVKIAILDTGIDDTHPDLDDIDDDPGTIDPKVIAAVNFSDDSTAMDLHGHGTHCAGIAAGTGAASSSLYRGVAPGAWLYNVKVLNQYGSGYWSWIISGIEYATYGPDGLPSTGDEANVISMSLRGWGTDGTDPASLACDAAVDQGIVVAVAAGNEWDYFTIGTPGVARKVITVGASDKSDTLASFSSKGPTIDYRVKPDVLAPGVSITSTVPYGLYGTYYQSWGGTSMSTPHVAGAAALMLQKGVPSGWSAPIYVKNALISTAIDLGYNVYEQGGGRIDVAKAATAKIMVDPATISFGAYTENVLDNVVLTFYNMDNVSHTLSLSATVADIFGFLAPGTLVAWLSENSISLPAGGDADVTLTIDTAVPKSLYSGKVIAAIDGGPAAIHAIFGFSRDKVKIATIYPTEDAQVAEGYPDSNFGDRTYVFTGNDLESVYKNERGFFKFNLPPIPDSTSILSARYHNYCWRMYGAAGENVQARAVEDDYWGEYTITWNDQPSYEEVLDTKSVPSVNSWYSWDITSFIQEQLAGDRVASLCMRAENENQYFPHAFAYGFESKEWWMPPRLEIAYIPSATLAPPHSDYGLDTDGDGLYNYLVVEVKVAVTRAGWYGLSGDLYDDTGYYLGYAWSSSYLDVGTQTLWLYFLGYRINSSGRDGPYQVYLSLYDTWYGYWLDSGGHWTAAYTHDQFQPPPAEFAPPHSDYGLDTDDDGLYNYLVVEAKVAVDTAGWYRVYSDLYDSYGYWIAYTWAENYLEAGIQTIELKFKGYEIKRSGRDGPYRAYMSLYGTEGWLDEDEHWTAAYTHEQFQPPPAEFCPPHFDYGLDTDGDGLYNYLVVEVGVAVIEAGWYRVESNLYDGYGNWITYTWTENYLEAGFQTIELRFKGYEIERSGRDGPYRAYMSLYGTEGWLDEDEHWTAAYTHDQFQPPTKLAPPHSDYGLDTDNDGLYNCLVVEVNVAASTAGWYRVYSDLYDNAGYWIADAWTENYLETGTQTIELRFEGERINRSGRDGPYRAYLSLYDEWWNWLDSDEHWTAAYTHNQFQYLANFAPPHSDYGLDTDNDNLYNYLVVEVNVAVATAGWYRISSSLYDNAGYWIADAWTYNFLEKGTQTVKLGFEGERINRSGGDGPYRAYLSLYDEWGNWLDSGEHWTAAYTHDQFQYLAKFAPPHSNYGLDTDNDGLYNYLVVEVRVAVATAGWYGISSSLYDNAGYWIADAWAYNFLEKGTQTVKLGFEGERINRSGRDGPYRVYLSLYDEWWNWLDSDEHWTAAYTHDQFQYLANFAPPHSDYGLDTDNDNLYNYLVVEVNVAVVTAGTYRISSSLYDNYGYWIASASAENYLEAGIQTLELRFEGERINRSGRDGPYLAYLSLYDEWWNWLDSDEHWTAAYTHDQFQYLANFAPPHSDYGLDTDNDGLYNYLVVKVNVAASTAGWYRVYSDLYDSAYNWIAYAYAENYLEAGIQTLELKFKGYEIERSGRDGPYLAYLSLYDEWWNWLDSGEHWTAAYTHDQFQPPPSPDIWVEPTSFDVTLPPDTSENYTLIIGNNGNAPLTYDIRDAETTFEEAVEGKISAQKVTLPNEGPFSKSKDIVRYTVNVSDIEPTGDWQLLLTDPDEPDIWMDLKEVYAKDDGSNLYFKVVFYEAWPGDPHNYIDTAIFLDTDQNQGTGLSNAQGWYEMNNIGADYAAVVGREGDSVWKWDGGWIIPWAPFTYLDLNPYTDVFEAGISLYDIGNPNAIDLIVANIDISSGWKWDYAPVEGDGHVTYNISDCPWLDENPKSGTVEPGSSDEITVSIDTTGLAPGDYSAKIVINNNDPDEDPKVVPVHLTVAHREWDALITATFSEGSDDAIFGVRPDATSGFDSKYDVPEPPAPPEPPYVRAYFYYPEQTPDELHRSCLAPENFMEWPLRIEYDDDIENVTLTWSVENIPSEYFVLLFRGGNLVADMRAEDNYIFEASAGSYDFRIVVGTIVPFTLELTQGWNMISFPVLLENMNPDSIFDGYYVLYRWDAENKRYVLHADSGSFIEPDPDVEVGAGYWAYVLEDENVALLGVPVNQLTLSLRQGWNLIGTPYGGSSITDPIDDPDNSVLLWAFTWNAREKRYNMTQLLEAGKGYWVYAFQGCELTLIGGK